MSSVSATESALLCKYLQSFSGYVLDFTSRQDYCNYIFQACGLQVDPYSDDYANLSMVKILKVIISREENEKVCALLQQMLEYGDHLFPADASLELVSLKEHCKKIVQKLQAELDAIELPVPTTLNSGILLEEINRAIRMASPVRALDRMHTLAVIVLRNASKAHGLDYDANTPLHGLCGQLWKYYQWSNCFQSDFPVCVIKSTVPIFEKLNYIRNSRSLAHDNDLLNEHESEFVLKMMSLLLVFIQKTEEARIGL